MDGICIELGCQLRRTTLQGRLLACWWWLGVAGFVDGNTSPLKSSLMA